MKLSPLSHFKPKNERRLQLNSNFLSSNAKIVSKAVRAAGFELVGVAKGCFQRKEITDAMIGADIQRIAISQPNAFSVGIDSRLRSPVSLYPSSWKTCSSWPSQFIRCETDLEIIDEIVRSHFTASSPLKLMVPVLTRDGREGISSSNIIEFGKAIAARYDKAVVIRGLQFCYGCVVEVPPTEKEIGEMVALAESFVGVLNLKKLTLSVGGSVCLPILPSIIRPPTINVELRIGEAILAGTIPGSGSIMGLQPTTKLVSNVIQKRSSSHGGGSVIVDCGKAEIAGVGTSLVCPHGLIKSMSSEQTVLRIKNQTEFDTMQTATFRLSYEDMVRSFGRPFVQTRR